MTALLINLVYGLLWAIAFIAFIPAFIVIEQRYFTGSFRLPVKCLKPIQAYAQYFHKIRMTLMGDKLSLLISTQILSWAEIAYLTALWLVLPYQMQIQDNNLLVWLFLAIMTLPLNIINTIINAEYLDSEIGTAGIYKNGISLLSSFLPVLFSVLIVITVDQYGNFSELSLKQGGFWLGFIPHWNIFRSPFHCVTAIGFLANLIVLMRANDGGFQPFEFQEPAEIYSGRRESFGNFLQFNRSAMFFTLVALMVFLFLGGWQSPVGSEGRHLASLLGGIWFLCKTILVFSACLAIKYRLPFLSRQQILNINLKIQVPVLAINWLGLLISRWL